MGIFICFVFLVTYFFLLVDVRPLLTWNFYYDVDVEALVPSIDLTLNIFRSDIVLNY